MTSPRPYQKGVVAPQNEDEAWLPVPGFEDRYEVSTEGNVRSLISTPPRALTRQFEDDGYPVVGLWDGRKQTNHKIHRLVALAFLADGQNALHCEVAHLDGDRANPKVENLKWVSRVENCAHKRRHGTHQVGERHPQSRLTEEAVRCIRSSQDTARELAERFSVSVHTISDIRRGLRWRHSFNRG